MNTTSITGTSRVISLVDMDCFYVQVEERDNPSIKGVPAAVVQYKAYKGGGIIAVNYEARAKGVSRNMRGDEAMAACPEIKLVRVPETRGKADLTKYREAGREVIQVLTEFSDCVERASIDEAYIDLTTAVEERLKTFSAEQALFSNLDENNILQTLDTEAFNTNYVMGFESTESWLEMIKDSEMLISKDDLRLAIAAEIVGKMREAVYVKTGFRCSAGIAHNKVVAKLCAGINKPNKQTVLPHSSVVQLWAATKIQKVRNLGGKLGEYLVNKLKVEFMSELLPYSEKELSKHVGSKAGAWIYQLARGYDDEAVNPRQLPKSVGCNKNFLGPEALTTKDKVKHWLQQLTAEVLERIHKDFEMNNRRAKTLTLHVSFEEHNSLSRACRLNPKYNAERIAADVWSMMEKLYKNLGVKPVNMLGLIASKFEDEIDVSGYAKISNFFSEDSGNRSTAIENGAAAQSTAGNALIIKKSSPPPATVTSSSCATASSTSTSCTATETDVIPATIIIPSKNPDQILPPSMAPIKRSIFFTPKEKSPQKSLGQSSTTVPSAAPASTAPGVSPTKIPMTQECERCGKLIALWEYVSHMDFHIARDISREINGLPPLGFDVRPETLEAKEREREKLEREQRAASSPAKKRARGGGRGGGGGASKRGRGSSISSPKKPLTLNPIDSYFVKKS